MLNRLNDTVSVSGTVIVSDDGHHAVVQTEYRHEYKTLQFEIDTKYCLGRTKRRQDQVHSVSHKGTDCLYHNRGRTYLVDLSDELSIRTETFHGKIQFLIEFQIKHKCHGCRNDLSDNRSYCSSGDSHPGQSEISEDQDRIQDDIDDRADSLRDHGVDRLAGSL